MRTFLHAPLCAFLTIATISIAAAQSNLDQPVSRTPTIRSELIRGTQAAFQCTLDHIGRFAHISRCISAVVDSNVQRQMSSDPFELAVYLTALEDWEVVGSTHPIGGPLENPPDLIAASTEFWTKEIRRLRKTVKVSAKDFCGIAGQRDCQGMSAIFERTGGSAPQPRNANPARKDNRSQGGGGESAQ